MEHVREDQRTSLRLSLCLGAVMAMDFMIVYLSIFEYWTQDLGGSMHAFGLVFACYDLTQLIFLPLFGVSVRYVGFRALFILSLVLNMVGNVLYSTALNGDEDTATFRFVAGRLIAGIGSASYVLILGHMVMSVPTAHRGEGFVMFRLYTFFGRFSGPVIGFLLLYVPETTIGSLKFDGKTLPGWVIVVLDAVLLLFYCSGKFVEPVANERLVEDEPSGKKDLPKSALRSIGVIFVTNFVLMFGFWCMFGQMMPITIIRYRFDVKDASSVYGVCGLGFFAASMAYRRIAKRKLLGEGSLAAVGSFIAAASCALTMQYSSDYDTDKPLRWMWYLGSGFLVFGFSLTSSVTAALYSIVVDDTPHLMPLLALIAISSALGRFSGPSFSSLILSYDVVNASSPCDREHMLNCRLEQGSINSLVGMVAGFMLTVCSVALLYYRRIQRNSKDEEDIEVN